MVRIRRFMLFEVRGELIVLRWHIEKQVWLEAQQEKERSATLPNSLEKSSKPTDSSKIITALESLPKRILFPHSEGVPSWNRIYVSKWQK